MSLYRSKVTIAGYIYVNAKDENEARFIIETAQPSIGGKALIGAKTSVEKIEHQNADAFQLQPENVKTVFTNKTVN